LYQLAGGGVFFGLADIEQTTVGRGIANADSQPENGQHYHDLNDGVAALS
jgi:hypothetical protein